VSAGEEGVTVGSAAALEPRDVICCQYRETGVFQQRGFTLKDFMSQLVSNRNDPGKGRNMPVHYSGKNKVGAVHSLPTFSLSDILVSNLLTPCVTRSMQ
jgi:2-oxoisovalerate dehydrogenase E1 component alpha subunit